MAYSKLTLINAGHLFLCECEEFDNDASMSQLYQQPIIWVHKVGF